MISANRIVKSNIWDISKSAFNFSIFFFLVLITILSMSQKVWAQLSVTKTQMPDPCSVEVGTSNFMIEYEVVVQNNSGVDTGPVTFIDTLPDLNGQQTTLVPDSAAACLPFNDTLNRFNCSIDIPSSGSFTLGYSVMITPESTGSINNRAGLIFSGLPRCSNNLMVECADDLDCTNECNLEGFTCSLTPADSCLEGDPPCVQGTCQSGGSVIFPSNEVTCEVTAMSEVSITKSSPTNPPGMCITPGENNNVTFDINLVNNGSANASSVMVTDQLPEGFNFVSVSPSPECFEDGMIDNLVICDLDDLGPMGGTEVISIMTTINPDPGQDFTNPNQATIDFTDDGTGMPDMKVSNEVSICIESDCNESFDGQFDGMTMFVRTDPAFPEDEDVEDATSLSISNVIIDTGTFDGEINADWIQDVSLTNVDCIGSRASFEGTFNGTCPGTIQGDLNLLIVNQIANEIAVVNGVGIDCKGPYVFLTDPGAPLIREGTTGNGSGMLSGSSGVNPTAGCALADGTEHVGALPILIYLLIPALIFIRRRKNTLIGARKLLKQITMFSSVLLFFALLMFGISFIGTMTASAQTILKNCEDANVNRSIAESLDLICSELKSMEGSLNEEQQGLLNTCEQIIQNQGGSTCAELARSIVEPITILNELLSVQSQNQFKTIRSRLSNLRAGGGGSNISLAGNAIRTFDNDSGPLLASNTDTVPITNLSLFSLASESGSSGFSKLGAYLNGAFNFGDRDNTSNRNGYDYNIFELIAGLDYRLTDYFIIGASFNYSYTDVDSNRSRGEITSNAFYGTVYGSTYWNSLYVDGLVSLGGANYDISRDVDGSVEKGSPDGLLYRLGIAVGYDIDYNSFSLSPYGRLNYSQNNVNSYTERTVSGEPGLSLDYRKQEAKSFTSALGTQASYAWSTAWGVIFPQLLAEWIHEFENNPDTVVASFNAANKPSFSARPPSTDEDFFNLGGGIYTLLPHEFSIFVYYERTVGYDNLNPNYITGGVRKEF